LKQIYNAIETYCGQSGFHWDHDHGRKIEGEAVQAVWNEYIYLKEGMSHQPFHNNGWEFYKQIHDIFPSGGVQGANVFQGTVPQATSATMHSNSIPTGADDMQVQADPSKPSTMQPGPSIYIHGHGAFLVHQQTLVLHNVPS
ncbi:hypothetical protein PAXRUDRAFT_149213, partial [Paxillus rubicundulus Ve08.2h10]